MTKSPYRLDEDEFGSYITHVESGVSVPTRYLDEGFEEDAIEYIWENEFPEEDWCYSQALYHEYLAPFARKTKKQRKKWKQRQRKKKREEANVVVICDMEVCEAVDARGTTFKYVSMIDSLGYCYTDVTKQNSVKEQEMTTQDNLDTKKKNHLSYRADAIYREKQGELKTAFGMQPISPKSLDEIIEKIKNDKFEISEDTPEWFGPFDRFLRLKWKGDVEEDKKGYEAAQKELKAEYTRLQDTIVVADPKEALDAVYAFEAKSFS